MSGLNSQSTSSSNSIDQFLIGGWQATDPKTGQTNYLVFNGDGTFSGLYQNGGLAGTWTVDQSQTPWWLTFLLNNTPQTRIPSVYFHESGSPVQGGGGSSKTFSIAVPSPPITIFLGEAQRPSSLANATVFSSTSSIPSFTTTTTTGGSISTGFGVSGQASGGTTWTNCGDCVEGCRKTCLVQDVGRARCAKKCQKIVCSHVC